MFKKMILFIVSAEVGTFICSILENSPMNIWVARSIGCLVSVEIGVLLYELWIKKSTQNADIK